ncbi:hypothetical protein EC2872800_2966 [Escherichia coli 2872800]|nr:hypothetical protein EC2875000_3120 [Escherichia coli 2875000]EMV45358.1 hypothetical protein EC2872800_2966 [Escherichia coli 2872800]EMV56823.1 hypothetical protein EC2867750_3145 [Escherichia coli 2867750]EMV71063.1 hypothetical protein EC2866450_3006 [Escherichia coli 2866450]EMV74777.1 hypothetical protein EC2866750_2962 [Escherichia coli 2866750]EMV76472.1 hypothetical protein EC2866550_1058 [Escherichia coli 2866550]EMW01102.1 hypothetical protein EC2853500_3136 [Escherichia coli 28
MFRILLFNILNKIFIQLSTDEVYSTLKVNADIFTSPL